MIKKEKELNNKLTSTSTYKERKKLSANGGQSATKRVVKKTSTLSKIKRVLGNIFN